MDDNIVNYPRLKQLVARAAGVNPERASEFLHAFFQIITQQLSQGESVKIKGLGTFRRAEDCNGSPTVAFVPDVELADAINSPFAFFEAVELSPSVSADDLASIGEMSPTISPALETSTPAEVSPTEEPADEEVSAPEINEQDDIHDDEHDDEQDSPTQPATHDDGTWVEPQPESPGDQPIPDPGNIADTDADASDGESGYEPDERHASGFGWGWILVGTLIGLMIGFGAGYLCHDSLEARLIAPPIAETVDHTEVMDIVAEPTPDTIPTQPEATPSPVESKVYDTISPTRFLTTMARRHYGQMDYWVYIYMENTDRLGHPNRARPGTVVRIPPLSKYVEHDDTAALQKARRLSAEIYDRYK